MGFEPLEPRLTPASLSIGSASLVEGNSGSSRMTFTVTLASPQAGKSVTVDYNTGGGTATAGADYVANSGTLTLTKSQPTATVQVAILGDTLNEDDETFTLALSNPVGATIGRGTALGTILDNDPLPSLTIGDVAYPEGGPDTPSITVTLSAPSGRTVTVAYATADGTATAGVYYPSASGTLTFAPGETTKSIAARAFDDSVKEPDETYFIQLSNPANATIAGAGRGTRTILNDDFSRIAGRLYNDLNGNGVQDSGEPALAGRTVYVDLDRDGQPGAGEPTATTDATGAYSFSNLPAGTYEVRQVVPADWAATAPGPLSDFTDNWFSLSNQRDLIYDPTRQRLYATTSDGKIQRFDVATQALLPAWTVGTSLYGGDITPDGRYLYVSEGQYVSNGGVVHKVNLDDGTVTDLFFPAVNGYISGSFDVKIGPDGKGLIESTYFRAIDTATDAITLRSDSPGAPNIYSVHMARGADRSAFLMADTSDDAGRFFTYDATTAAFGPLNLANAFLSSSQVGVNRDGSLLAMEVDGGIGIFDRSDHSVAVLPYDGGFIFDPRRDVLYAADSAGLSTSDALVAIDTKTWQVLYRIALNENLPDSSVFGPGEMEISNDGSQLFLSTSYGVRWFNLPSPGARRVTLADGQQVAGLDFLSVSNAPQDLPSLSVDDPSVPEGSDGLLHPITFTVSLSAPSARTVTVGYAIRPGSATLDDNDYSSGTGYGGTLRFAPGQTSMTVTVQVRGDTKDELDETMLLQLSAPTNATIADAQGVGTILNDDTGPRGSITGVAYDDADRSGYRTAGEAPLAGATVYLDQNANSRLDPWEISTTSAADGSYTFANLPAGSYNVAWVVPDGYESTQAASSPVRGTFVGFAAIADRRDLVFDPTRALLYITTGHGTIERYDVAAGTLLAPWSVGSSLGGADITPDGRFLYVAEAQRGPTQGLIYKVDLATGAATTLRYDLTADEGGPYALSVGSDGSALFSATFEGSGFTPIRRIDPTTGAITVVTGSTQDRLVVRGADRGLVYLTQGNSSAGAISTYDVATGTLPATIGLGNYLSHSAAAVSRTGGLFAVEYGLTSSGVNVYDRNLNLVASPTIGLGGMVFDPVRDLLYASDGVNLKAYDTATWTARLVGQYDEQSGSSEPFGNGEMAISPDGRNLFIATPSGVRAVQIAPDLKVVYVSGNAATADLGAARPPAPTISIDDVSRLEGNGPSGQAFGVTLSRPSATPVTVSFATADGTARAGSDYTARSGTLTFAPGEVAKTVAVPINGDFIDEPDETYTVNLSNATGAAIARAVGTGTIRDDDPAVALRITGTSVKEGDSGSVDAVFTVTILNSAGSGFPVTVNYATGPVTNSPTATAGSDYIAQSGTLTFNPGETTKTISVPVLGDLLNEFNEAFLVTLSSPTNATVAASDGTATGTIFDNDPVPTVNVGDAEIVEGNSGRSNMTFTATLSSASGKTVSVRYQTGTGDPAVAGLDFVATEGTLTFNPGETTKTFTVAVIGDLLDEPDETFGVGLFSPINVNLARTRAVGTIRDDDPTPTLAITDASVTEGNSGTTSLAFNVTLSAPSGQVVTVTYATADGNATAGLDYVATSGTLTFSPGATTGTITVPVLADTLDEDDELLTLTLSSPTNATLARSQAIGAIVDDDPTPTVTLALAGSPMAEAGGVATVTATLSAPSGRDVSVQLSFAGTATPADDYVASDGWIVIPAGHVSGSVTLTAVDDMAQEPDETIVVGIASAINATPQGDPVTATILDDDQPPGGTSASYLGSDVTTRGTWRGAYGADGYVLAGDAAAAPAYAGVALSGQQGWTWAASTADARALQKAADPADRVAATWFAAGSFRADVAVADGAAHRLSLYFLDFDGSGGGRTQRVELLDGDSGAVLDARDVAAFQGGTYLSWAVAGHVAVRITNTNPAANAVLSGIFFD